jgi:hypothetical protein
VPSESLIDGLIFEMIFFINIIQMPLYNAKNILI